MVIMIFEWLKLKIIINFNSRVKSASLRLDANLEYLLTKTMQQIYNFSHLISIQLPASVQTMLFLGDNYDLYTLSGNPGELHRNQTLN